LTDNEHAALDALQSAYTKAVDAWIASIQLEKSLVSIAQHSLAEVDKWEAAHFDEEDARTKVKIAKENYEDALRARFFDF
jgi:hypothetical protein